LNRIKRKNNFEKLNFELNPEIVDLRFKIISDLPRVNNNIKTNINLIQFKTILNFNKTRPFQVIDTDKNTGSAIISNELHDKLVHQSLSDNTTYEEIHENPKLTVFNTVNNKLNDLFNSKNISKQIYKALLPDVNNKIGKFRILAKLHKKDFAIRPIINCKNHFTEKISIFIDHLLKPIIENSESYLKDSQNLLQIVNNLTLSDNLELYSCDFSTLYTNIKLDDALYYTMFSLVNKIDSIYVTPYGLYKLLKLVLYNNVFSYLNQFFRKN
jgi:hypothetical protein